MCFLQVCQVLHGFDFLASLASHEAPPLSSQERCEHQGVDRTSRRANVAEAPGSSACCGRDRVNFVLDQSRDAGRDGNASSLRRPEHDPVAEPHPCRGDDVVPSLKVREDVACGAVCSTSPELTLHVFLSLCSIFMLRFMMLGSNINKKYQNTSLLLTEQVRQRMLVLPNCCCRLLLTCRLSTRFCLRR